MVRNLGRWDSLLSLGLSALFLVLVLTSDRPLTEAKVPLAAAVSLGIAIATGAAVAGNRLADSTKDDAFGEIVRAIDPSGRHIQRPYFAVSVTGVACAAVGGILLVAGDQMSRTWAAWSYGLEVLLASYALFGFLDLLWLGYRNHTRQSRLRAMREAEDRRSA